MAEQNLYFKDSRFEMTHFGRFCQVGFLFGLWLDYCFLRHFSFIRYCMAALARYFIVLNFIGQGKTFWQANKVLMRAVRRYKFSRLYHAGKFYGSEYAYERALVTGGNFYLFL